MVDRQQCRCAFSDISNTVGEDEETKMREERNRKQCEYSARKRAEQTIEQREEHNRKQCEYRARKKTLAISTTPNHGIPYLN
ncbi:hypothetical protein SORBI_3009G055500 [Sorghum bicolor]|uniref:Uncharacterized protein n=1 Tax=Sorghum bicolor TaxID=4558 RepID=A0A1B6P721_SORBI|nr:hypothetical protein SORBI_3009G055500 [Sorghum bicolor]KXG21386.1 hypothetical protein SORBI_3009G055500 [Sorghum bicolor]OQU77493.1 hypothetical protein SORBI_3009G055500 [Sorghum bicolor]OQU77494.1 hypothetical protein SORBI_3009G055500 [Sorghum bicolor]